MYGVLPSDEVITYDPRNPTHSEEYQKTHMKKVEIKQFTHAEVDAPQEPFGFLKIPIVHTLICAEGEHLEVSDGYHTMDELYDHRITLFIALCKLYENYVEPSKWETANPPLNKVWRSKLHADGTSYDGWFILGIGKEKGKQITYHLPLSRWVEANFAETLEKAPEWDGHKPNDVLQRLKSL